MWPFKKKRERWSDDNIDLLHEIVKEHGRIIQDLVRLANTTRIDVSETRLPKLSGYIHVEQKASNP